jgi:hypothetical protein
MRARDKRGHDKTKNRREPMPRTTPPFRADHVGSLLRPAAVKEARAKRAAGPFSLTNSRRSKMPRSNGW